MADHPQIRPSILARFNAIYLELSEAYEETAWTDTRWMVAKRTLLMS